MNWKERALAAEEALAVVTAERATACRWAAELAADKHVLEAERNARLKVARDELSFLADYSEGPADGRTT